MQKFSVGLTLCVLLILTACVSESSYVGSDRQVGERNLDNSEAARTRISLGLNYLRRGDTTQAKYNLERAKAFAPDMPEVYNALAYYYQTVGEHVQAEDAYKQALDKDSDNADAYNNYGAFLCQVGKYAEAEELLLTAISRPGYIRVAESYENLALCQLDQQGFNKAKTFLESSVSHNGTRISSLINLAALNYAMGDNVGAKTSLQRIQRLGRVSARSTLLNYLVAEKQGDTSTMQHAEQLLLTLYIDTPEARLLLQQRLLESEFEQLREQYKLSLMANIVLPDTATAEVTREAVANPKLKVVRRKTSEPADPAQSSPANNAPAIAIQATTADRSESSQAIAGALVLSPVAPENNSSPLAAEQQAARQLAEQQAASKQQAEQDAANQLIMVATRPVSLPAETLLVESNAIDETARQRLPMDEMATVQPAPDDAQVAADTTEADNQPDEAGEQSAAFHIVQEGQSLYTISVAHNIRLARLMEWNNLTPESVIKTGQRIWLAQVSDSQLQPPPPVTRQTEYNEPVEATEPYHQVTSGETMFGISYRYNIRLESFMAWNNLTEQSKLQVGQQVFVTDPASVKP